MKVLYDTVLMNQLYLTAKLMMRVIILWCSTQFSPQSILVYLAHHRCTGVFYHIKRRG